MDINKALTMAKNLRNHFKVFEEMEEFMREAVALQNVVKEFEAKKAQLQKEIADLEAEKVDFSDAVKKKKADMENRLIKWISEIDKQHRERSAEIESQIQALVDKRMAAELDLEATTKNHRENMEKIQAETEMAANKLKVIEKRIEEIKAKL